MSRGDSEVATRPLIHPDLQGQVSNVCCVWGAWIAVRLSSVRHNCWDQVCLSGCTGLVNCFQVGLKRRGAVTFFVLPYEAPFVKFPAFRNLRTKARKEGVYTFFLFHSLVWPLVEFDYCPLHLTDRFGFGYFPRPSLFILEEIWTRGSCPWARTDRLADPAQWAVRGVGRLGMTLRLAQSPLNGAELVGAVVCFAV
jgi:hypothetical protein